MQFMVIERFRNQNAKTIYGPFRDKVRLMPDGLSFVGSWMTADLYNNSSSGQGGQGGAAQSQPLFSADGVRRHNVVTAFGCRVV